MSECKNIIELINSFSTKEKCINFIIKVRWNNKVRCAFCNHRKVYHLQGRYKRFKCAECKKQFSATKGTLFENSTVPLQKWFIAIYLILSHKKGISSTQLSRDLKVTQKTAWFMLQRIRYMLKAKSTKSLLRGVIQIDETFIGGKNKNRPWHKKVKYSQGRSFKDKTPVLGMLNDRGQLQTKVIPNTKAHTIKPIINKTVAKNSIIVTDEWKAYSKLYTRYNHYIVDHSRKQYVNENGFTTNALEGAWSHLKRMIIGVYHKVSRKYLQRYCDEFTYRYNTRALSDIDRFMSSLFRIESRLKYDDLVGASMI